MLVPLGVIVLILGVYPHAMLNLLNTSLVASEPDRAVGESGGHAARAVALVH